MSISGSLVGYENNNDVNNKRNRAMLNISATTNNSTSKQQCPSLNSSISNSVITTASSNCSSAIQHKKHLKHQELTSQHPKKDAQTKNKNFHLNTLWSVWYGILVTLFQGYLIVQGAHRYLGCKLLSWKYEPPTTEFDIQITVCGLVILFLPLFLASAIFKVGNFANDGVKLATGPGRCSAEPADGLEIEAKGGTLKALWTHGGPTSSFIHIITALCLLLPRLLLESKLIENGHLPKDNVWRTELDFMITHKDRLVVLSFMTSTYLNNSEHLIDTRLPSSAVFEKTHLIERIHDEYDDEMYDTHENLQSEIPFGPSSAVGIVSTQQDYDSERLENESWVSATTVGLRTTSTKLYTTTTPRTTTTTTATTTTSTTTTTPKPSSTTVQMRTIRTTPATTPQELVIMDQVTTTEHPHLHRKHDRNRTHLHGHGRKHKQHHHKEKDHKKEKERRRDDEMDTHLELIPDHIDFDDILDPAVTPVFEVSKNSKQHLEQVKQVRPSTPSDTTITVVFTEPAEEKPTKIKKLIKDSDVHILKPEIMPDTHIPSTTVTTNSKIIEIRPSQGAILMNKSTSLRRAKRFAREPIDDVVPYGPNMPSVEEDDVIVRDEETGLEIHPSFLIGAIPGNMSILETEFSGLAKLIKSIIGHVHPFDAHNWSFFPSLEFVNFVIAIIVFSVRYPSVFWGTSKSFSIVFSIQMVANGIDILLNYAGISVLYKLQNVGSNVPMQASGLLLNGIVTVSLYMFAVLLTVLSSMVLYLYGHGRLSAKMRDRRMITVNKGGDAWSYFAHCASLCFVLAVAVVKAPIMHDLSTVYRNSLDGSVLAAALGSVVHLFFWIVLWLGLTAKRRWHFKIPPLEHISGATQPLLLAQRGRESQHGDDQIYWPKIAPNSPKLKVTFNEVPSTSSDHDLSEHDGKRNKVGGAQVRLSAGAGGPLGEIDDGDYATLRGPLMSDHQLRLDDYGILPMLSHDHADDTGSEEGKLLACVRDDSVTYASTRDLLPPTCRELSPEYITSPNRMLSPNRMMTSPLGPVSVTVHSTEVHISTVTPRCLRRADSGVPNEHGSLTPRSDTTSTESSTSPPEKANSESSSGVHSGEEKDEVVIRPRPPSVPYKSIIKPPPITIAEPFGRSTNMQMSSFKENGSSATLPSTRNSDTRNEYPQCNTMPLPIGNHQYKPQIYSPTATKQSQLHTTLPNGLRYSSNQYLRRMPHVKNAESPYGHCGMGSGHHTFSKLLHDPLSIPAPTMSTFNTTITTIIPEDRDSANYSMISDQDREMYINASQISQIQIN